MDLDKAKHVGCSLRKSADGESIEYRSGEGPSSESEKSLKKQKTNHASGKQHELKYCETLSSEKLKLKSDHEKELAEVIAEMNRKYEAKCQDAEAAIQSKRVEIETSFIKVVKNKLLADAFRSKGEYVTPFDLAVLGVQSGGMQFQGQPSVGHSASSSRAQISRILQQPPLQIVHQSAYLVPGTPTRPRSNPSSIPVRPPQSTSIPFSTPTRPPLINHITPSTRPPSICGPMTPFIRLSINSITPANRPPPNIKSITHSSRPPPSNNPNSTFARNPRAIRAPAPHIHPFTPQISSQSPAASVALPSLYSWHPSEQHPPVSLPAMSSLLPETSLPPMPSISVSNTGLYSASGGSLNLCLSAVYQQPNTLASQPEFLGVDEFGKEGGSSGQRDPESPGKYPKQQPPPPSAMKDEEAGLDDEENDEHDETLCGSCGKKYVSGEFWICCDFCERWFHGECVKITPARAEHIKQYKCPTCSNL